MVRKELVHLNIRLAVVFVLSIGLLVLGATSGCVESSSLQKTEQIILNEPIPAGDGAVLHADHRFGLIVSPDARIEKLADGFNFTEGPVWSRIESRLLFSDVRGNTIFEWSANQGVQPYIDPVFEGDTTGYSSLSLIHI